MQLIRLAVAVRPLGWTRSPSTRDLAVDEVEDADHRFCNLVFGCFNRNWEEGIDIPTGPNNLIEPGVVDQGQPAHFYPRRSQFISRVLVPADFGDQEVVWR